MVLSTFYLNFIKYLALIGEYLNFNLLVLLANDSINFSPLKNFKGINYAYDATNINTMKIKKNAKNLDFRKNAFLFDKNYKNWSKYLK